MLAIARAFSKPRCSISENMEMGKEGPERYIYIQRARDFHARCLSTRVELARKRRRRSGSGLLPPGSLQCSRRCREGRCSMKREREREVGVFVRQWTRENPGPFCVLQAFHIPIYTTAELAHALIQTAHT